MKSNSKSDWSICGWTFDSGTFRTQFDVRKLTVIVESIVNMRIHLINIHSVKYYLINKQCKKIKSQRYKVSKQGTYTSKFITSIHNFNNLCRQIHWQILETNYDVP
jgi:hypothetical protein